MATQSTTQVHLVYNNEHLLNRDKKTFEELIVLASLSDDSLQFQLGLDFVRGKDDIVIIDEADSMIFADPEHFKAFTHNTRCICLTATPDDQDGQGMEKAIIDALSFIRVAPVGVVALCDQPAIDRTLSFDNSKDL